MKTTTTKKIMNDFINKEVRLFPSDTHFKFAILLEVNEFGYIFKITDASKDGHLKIGDIVFYNHSCKMEFKLK